ncbi:uncharacterized protein LOC124372918 [Homalodisca vitripennis]|uniref:uncharacterized protein LOC124372918 n=1 Tax=Homalodisca vitripennis TaxID=197043 RepID=UPI001EEC23F3|nr:uncharacterized protein LOC124372918 [Homalodisca vitripennis]
MIVIGNIFFKQKVGSSFKIVIILCLYIGYTVQQCILGNCLFTSLVISVLYNMADPEVTLLQSGNVEPMPDNSTRKRKRRVDNWKKTKDKKKRHSAQGFPNIPTCGHRERANGSKHCYDCSRLNMQDIRRFHQGFYKSCNKIGPRSIYTEVRQRKKFQKDIGFKVLILLKEDILTSHPIEFLG